MAVTDARMDANSNQLGAKELAAAFLASAAATTKP
jgi:hypothetical protein